MTASSSHQPTRDHAASNRLARDLSARDLATGDHHLDNRQGLQALALSRSQAAQLHWRNNLLCRNLPLVRQIAQRHLASCGSCGGASLEDLESAGIFGLVRAIERFDLSHGTTLATYASPFIRGAIRQELRDHWQPVHTPRRLRELDQRARRLQEQRRGRGLPLLTQAALAQALGCSGDQLLEAEAAGQARRVLSLDVPATTGDGSPSTLLDLLAAPEPEPAEPWCSEPLNGQPGCGAPASGEPFRGQQSGADSLGEELLNGKEARVEEAAGQIAIRRPSAGKRSGELERSDHEQQRRARRCWQLQRLAQLDPRDRLLLQCRVLHGQSWRSVGTNLGLSHSAARQRYFKLCAQLGEEDRAATP